MVYPFKGISLPLSMIYHSLPSSPSLYPVHSPFTQSILSLCPVHTLPLPVHTLSLLSPHSLFTQSTLSLYPIHTLPLPFTLPNPYPRFTQSILSLSQSMHLLYPIHTFTLPGPYSPFTSPHSPFTSPHSPFTSAHPLFTQSTLSLYPIHTLPLHSPFTSPTLSLYPVHTLPLPSPYSHFNPLYPVHMVGNQQE